MYIIVGLGNPTGEYSGTRHNIGFDAVTALSDAWRIGLDMKKHKAVCGKGAHEGERVLLAQPQTFMNLSGESVRELLEFYKEDASRLIVICDDINLPPGQLRIREKGSAGGHNGLKNIITNIGTDEFLRIRIGVGEKPKNWDLADYVLGHFSKEEEPLMREALSDAVGACKLVIEGDTAGAMNRYNAKKEIKKELQTGRKSL
jgi:peptidyl-tRNA hydrolase, PTH1 family